MVSLKVKEPVIAVWEFTAFKAAACCQSPIWHKVQVHLSHALMPHTVSLLQPVPSRFRCWIYQVIIVYYWGWGWTNRQALWSCHNTGHSNLSKSPDVIDWLITAEIDNRLVYAGTQGQSVSQNCHHKLWKSINVNCMCPYRAIYTRHGGHVWRVLRCCYNFWLELKTIKALGNTLAPAAWLNSQALCFEVVCKQCNAVQWFQVHVHCLHIASRLQGPRYNWMVKAIILNNN